MATKKTTKKPAKKTTKKPAKKKKEVEKGSKLVCGQCGLVVTVDTVCGCVDVCDLVCCGMEMEAKG